MKKSKIQKLKSQSPLNLNGINKTMLNNQANARRTKIDKVTKKKAKKTKINAEQTKLCKKTTIGEEDLDGAADSIAENNDLFLLQEKEHSQRPRHMDEKFQISLRTKEKQNKNQSTEGAKQKAGRPHKPGLNFLVAECEKRGIPTYTRSSHVLKQRLKTFFIRDYGEKGWTTSTSIFEETKSANSSPDKPLHMSAQAYVDNYCQGKISNASPEWVATSKNSTSKWMKPTISNSKSSYIIRWVNA